jgi:hypothetical protein
LPPVITLDSHSESYRERFVQQSHDSLTYKT